MNRWWPIGPPKWCVHSSKTDRRNTQRETALGLNLFYLHGHLKWFALWGASVWCLELAITRTGVVGAGHHSFPWVRQNGTRRLSRSSRCSSRRAPAMCRALVGRCQQRAEKEMQCCRLLQIVETNKSRFSYLVGLKILRWQLCIWE